MPEALSPRTRRSSVLVEITGVLRALGAPGMLAALAAVAWGIAGAQPWASAGAWIRDAAVALVVAAGLCVLGLPAAARRERRRRSGIQAVDTMSGTAFEERLADLFGSMGYEVVRTGRTGDFGADLVLEQDGARTVVQAKRYERSVGIEAVQQVIGATRHYDAERAMVVTSASCTPAARALAESNQVVLVERPELVDLLAAHPLPEANGQWHAWRGAAHQLADGMVLAVYAAGLVLRGTWWALRALARRRR